MHIPTVTVCALACATTFAPGPVSAAPLTPGNVLACYNERIEERTPAGALVQSVDVPWPDGARPLSEHPRDVFVGPDGLVHVYNGTYTPWLSTWDPVLDTWTHRTEPGWSTENNQSLGSLAVVDAAVLVTDTDTPLDTVHGLVRFEPDGTVARLADTLQTIDVTMGLDGLVYTLGDPLDRRAAERRVHVFDPCTWDEVRQVDLFVAVRAVAVDADGTIFGAGWDGRFYRFTTLGAIALSLASGTMNLLDLDIGRGGQLVAGSRTGQVIFTDVGFSPPTRFDVLAPAPFVAWTDPPRPAVASGPLDVEHVRARRLGDDVAFEWTPEPAATGGYELWRVDEPAALPDFSTLATLVATTAADAGASNVTDVGAVQRTGWQAWYYQVVGSCGAP